jgi:hypothetical protein
MTDRAAVEQEIRRLLATETRTTVLSNALFQQGTGLFWKIATTEAERRVLVDTPLFKDAQARVRDLQYRDADILSRATAVLRAEVPEADVRVSIGAPARAAS